MTATTSITPLPADSKPDAVATPSATAAAATTPDAPIRVGIIGAAGLSAGKLMELLSRHPRAKFECLVSESSPGAPVANAHPQLRGVVDQPFDRLDVDRLATTCDVVFSAKRHGETFPYIRQLLAGQARVIDLSGDFRLWDPGQFQHWYGLPHAHPQLLTKAVYGMPELHRAAIREARLVANPGCYTTASILALGPLVKARIGKGQPIVINAISGVSGAGRNAKPENQFLAVADNVRPYRVGTHQHTPEIEQELAFAAHPDPDYRCPDRTVHEDATSHHGPPTILFVPHVGPFKAGILANSYLRVADGQPEPTRDSLHALLADAYKDEPFVRVLPPGELPQIEPVVNTNFIDIGVEYDARAKTAVVISVLDNLVKGAAGQAIQNMNLMLGLPERTGLA